MLQSAPAVHQHEDGDRPEPDVLLPESEGNEASYANEAEDRRDHQAAGAAQDKPEERTEDLAAIQRVDGKNVEGQKAYVDPEK